MCHVTARDTRSQRESLRMETRLQRIPDVQNIILTNVQCARTCKDENPDYTREPTLIFTALCFILLKEYVAHLPGNPLLEEKN